MLSDLFLLKIIKTMPLSSNPFLPYTEDLKLTCLLSLSSIKSVIIETEFCDFYGLILRELYPKTCPKYELICKALPCIRKYIVPGISGPVPDYEESYLRLAYVFTYSIIHSVVMCDRLKDMLEVNPTMLKKMLSLKDLSICILGGGPGFEAAAICKLLQKAKAGLESCTNSQLRMHITIIDLYAEWERVTERLFYELQKELQPQIVVDFCYIQANLTKELSLAVIEAIKSSHIVTMFKFVFEVSARYGCKNVEKMLKRIIENMSFKSCLFFLDNAGGGYFRTVDKMIDHVPCMTRIYGPILHHCHELNGNIVENYSSLVKNWFRNLNCTSKTTISCSAWLKIRCPPKIALKKLDKRNVKKK